MKKIILLSMCLSIVSSSFATQESIFTYDQDASLKDNLPIGTPSCEFTSIGKYPSFTTVKPIEKTIQILLCGKKSPRTGERGIVKQAADLKDLVVLRKMSDIGSWFKKENIKYQGWRNEAIIGQTIEDLFLPKRNFEKEAEHPMIAASKRNSVIILTLQSNEWLKGFAINMLQAFADANFNPTKKLLLVLNFIDDPELKTLDKTSKEFLSTYFELVDPRNSDVKKFFDDQQSKFFDIKDNMSHCDKYIDEGMREGLIRLLEKKFEDFKIKDNIVKVTFNLLLFEELYTHGFLLKLITSPINSLFTKPATNNSTK